MKIKKSGVLFSALALIVVVLALLPTVILPAMAQSTVTKYADNTFDDLTVGTSITKDNSHFYVHVPSLATVVSRGDGNNAVKLELKTAASDSTSVGGQFIYKGYQQYFVEDGKVTIGETSYPVNGGVVTIDGKNYTVYADSAAVFEALAGGSNVDKNIIVANTAMSYQTEDKVWLQVEYYVPTGAKGSVQSQFRSYSYQDANGNETSTNWLSLYTLDMETATFKSGTYKLSAAYALERDAWNTVTVVVDLKNASMDYYINNVYLFGETLTGKQNLTLKANEWVIAKLNKNGGDPNGYSGYVMIDHAQAYTFTESDVVSAAARNENGDPLLYLQTSNGLKQTYDGTDAKYFVGDSGNSATPVYFDSTTYADMLAPVPGASIRLTDVAGLRFATQLDRDLLDDLLQLKADGLLKNVELGTLIAPKVYVTEAGAFTLDALKALDQQPAYMTVAASTTEFFGFPNGITPDEGMDTCFVGSIVNIRLSNRSRDFSAVGYVKVTAWSGETKYLYSYDYDAATISDYSRNVAGVARAALADTSKQWTDAEKEILSGLANGAQNMDLNSTVITGVQTTANELYFRNAAGVYCRLTYDGNNGWRLQANASGYDYFDDTGAAQALAIYLGETPDNLAQKLTVTKTNGVLKITAADSTSYATLSYEGSFALKCFTADGTEMIHVTSIAADGEKVVLKGGLQASEAIYGGGERFDTVNKRGTAFTLYTADGWNSASSTYVAIPLFATSRGAGMFINRYETMAVDFGKTTSDEWCVSLTNDLMDCYFYATGKISDVLLGYTDLSGHSTLPEEWAQGELICRYGPDLTSLEDSTAYKTPYASYTDIPNYTSYYVKKTGKVSGETTYVAIGSEGITIGYNIDYTLLYNNSNAGKVMYYQASDGNYYKAGAKGNPAGDGVKTIVNNLINAGMKPTALILEAWGWNNISTNATAKAALKETIDWLDAQDIRTMLYMGVGALSSSMSGYKVEYQVRANVTTTVDGVTTTTLTHLIPKTSGTGENPDVGTSSTQQYLDITNPYAVEWYMDQIWGELIDLGVDGIKIDFCECMPNEGVYGNATIEYQWYDDTVFEGDDVHHAYATYFISLFQKSMLEQKAEKNIPDGFVVLSRGGGIGSQRNPYMWEGDQVRSFTKIEEQLVALINSGLSGIPFMTYDLAGYAYSGTGGSFKTDVATESEIFARAIEYSAFTSNIQSHGDVRHAYQMTEEVQEIYRNFTTLHEELIPYIQKYSQVACDTGMPVVRHLILQYQNDANVYDLKTQYMFGEALLVAPVTTENTTSKSVYLPDGRWLCLSNGQTYTGKQTVTIDAELGEIPVFLDLDCEIEDYNMLVKVFNGTTWQAISGVQLDLAYKMENDDPWGSDSFPPRTED